MLDAERLPKKKKKMIIYNNNKKIIMLKGIVVRVTIRKHSVHSIYISAAYRPGKRIIVSKNLLDFNQY